MTSTYLPLPEGSAELFLEYGAPVTASLFSNPGMRAVQITDSRSCNVVRRFTVWESEEAMMDFVVGDAHMAAVAQTGNLSRGGIVLSVWPERALASEITWEAALEQIATAEPYD